MTLFISIFHQGYAQSSVPCMILIQNGKIYYDYYKDKKQGMSATDFHINQYVEANYQYQQYLKYLKINELDSLFELAQPNQSIWDSVAILEADISYLKENYWTHEDFASYPVLGLNFEQIDRYFYWKSERMNFAFLQKKKKIKSNNSDFQPFSTIEYIDENSASWDEMIVSFSFPSITLISIAMNYSGKGSLSNPKSKKFDKWLNSSNEFKFLAYQPVDIIVKTALQKRLFDIGIKSVKHTDLTKILEYNNKCSYFEIVLNLPLSLVKDYQDYIVTSSDEEDKRVQEYLEKYSFPIIRRQENDILMVKPKSNYGQFVGVEKREGNFPLMVFRGVSIDKRTVKTYDEKQKEK
jgi:hypothetical protein